MWLIDADALHREFIDFIRASNNKTPNWNDAVSLVGSAPTVDAVPVVRCGECKNRDPEDHKCDCGHGILWQLPREDDWFCADGERKSNEVD